MLTMAIKLASTVTFGELRHYNETLETGRAASTVPLMDATILAHLHRRGSISRIEAFILYRCHALSRHISTLKRQGHNVRSEWTVGYAGYRYVRYRLELR